MTYSSEVLADSPAGYWRLGEATIGAGAIDSSGNGHTLNYSGGHTGLGVTGLLTGDADTAVDFNGVDERVSLTSEAWMQTANALTVECWFKTTQTTLGTLVARYLSGTNFILWMNAGQIEFWKYAGTGGDVNAITPLTYNDGLPHHVAVTHDGTSIKIYIDGALVVTTTPCGNMSNTQTGALTIGMLAGSYWFDGVLDDVAYYTSVLSAARVLAHYAAGSGGGASPQTVDVGQAVETDTALSIAVLQGQSINVGIASEADTALPIGVITPLTITVTAQGDAQSEASASASVSIINEALTDNRTGGRWRNGSGTATWAPPVYIPSEPTLGERVAALVFSTPVVNDATGRISYTAVKEEIPAYVNRILVGNKDVTSWRGVITPFPSYSYIEPLGYGPAVLTFPQVHASFERPGVGALRFLRLGSPVIVERVDPVTEEVVVRDYKGVIISHDHSGGAFTVQVGGEASGRASLRQEQVPLFFWHTDLGRMAHNAVAGLGLPFDPYLGPITGIRLVRFGGMGLLDYIQQVCRAAQTRNGNQWTVMPHDDGKYRMEQKDTTTIHGTIYLDDARATGSLVRDMSEEPNRIFMTGVTPESLRVRFGAYPGLKFTSPPPYPFTDNRTFGEGTTNEDTDTGDSISILVNRLVITKYLGGYEAPGGYDADVTQAVKDVQKDGGLPRTGDVNPRTWRVLYDLNSTGYSLQGSRIMPAAEREAVKPWNLSPSGARISRNAEYDPSVLPVDRNVDAGTGFERSQLREWAYAELGEAREDNYVGSIALSTGALITGEHNPGDPFTEADVMPARDLRAGMNLWLPLFAGGIVVHVSGVSVSESGEVSADVDTRARDAMEVWEVITRNRESRVSLRRAWMIENRQSAQIKDSSGIWDEVGGILGDKVVIPHRQWIVFPVVAGKSGTIRSLRVNTNPNAEYVMAVFGKRIDPNRLRRLVGNPLTRAGSKRWERESVRATLDRQNLLLYIAGTDEEPLGYFPKTKTKEGDDGEGHASLTGRWEDDASFPYFADPTQVLWVAVWADRNTVIPQGRIMWPVLESGT